MNYFRPEIELMAGYVPGEQPQAGKFIKLNTNENPYPPSPAVKQAIAAVLERGLGRYPDPMAGAFRRRAAEVLGVDPDWILCGNGSDDILTIVTRALVGQRQWLRLPYPSYILYKTLAQLQGAHSEEVLFESDWSLSEEFSEPKNDLKLAFLPNPNSPSGTMLSRQRILELAERLPCPLLVDEAYADFADENCHVAGRPETKRSWSRGRSASPMRWPDCGSVFMVAQPQLDRAVHQGQRLVQLRFAGHCRGHRGHRRPGLAGGKSGQNRRKRGGD